MKLSQLTKICRSKNAGPFHITLDVLFEKKSDYMKVKESKVWTAKLIAELYGVPVEKVRIFESDSAMAFKATIPRKIISGGPHDTDVYGAQHHAPLLDIEIPD